MCPYQSVLSSKYASLTHTATSQAPFTRNSRVYINVYYIYTQYTGMAVGMYTYHIAGDFIKNITETEYCCKILYTEPPCSVMLLQCRFYNKKLLSKL